MKQSMLFGLFVLSLLVGGLGTNVAFAVDPPGEHAPTPPAHAGAGTSGHGEPAEHGGAAAAHGEHHTYTGDDDQDGIPNWRDSMNGDVPNEDTYILANTGFHLINFILLVAGLVYFVRRPVLDSFRERALGIRTELTETARTRDTAHQHHQELIARLEKIENEVKQMDQDAEVEAKREEEKLIERARREAVRITEQVERNIRDESTRARMELRQEAVELAIKLAEGTLRQGVSAKDQQALAKQFLASVKESDRV